MRISLLAPLLLLAACATTPPPAAAPTPASEAELAAAGARVRMAFVLTQRNHVPDPADVLAAYARAAPQDAALSFEGRAEDGPEGAMTYAIEGVGALHAMLLERPVPAGEADDAAERSAYSIGTGWELPPHAAHIAVILQPRHVRSSLETLRVFTRAVAAIVEAEPDAVGVYWGEGSATHEAKFFVELAKEELPLPLWAGVSVASDGPDRISLLSYGMSQLDLPDLHLTAPRAKAQEALGFFYDSLVYVTRRGAALPEGDTIGHTEAERHPVRYAKSPVDPEATVWRIDL